MSSAPSILQRWWPILVVVAGGLMTAAVGQYKVDANAQSIEANSEAIENNADHITGLKDRVVEEGTQTQLELQRLRLQQESSQRSAEQRDREQQRTLEAILEAVRQ
jgi:hypothetical protein